MVLARLAPGASSDRASCAAGGRHESRPSPRRRRVRKRRCSAARSGARTAASCSGSRTPATTSPIGPSRHRWCRASPSPRCSWACSSRAKRRIPHHKSVNVEAVLAQVSRIQSQIPDEEGRPVRVLDRRRRNCGETDQRHERRLREHQRRRAADERLWVLDHERRRQSIRGKAQPYSSVCHGWPAVFKSNTQFFAPDVSVLVTGATESYPVVVNGKVLKPGTPQYQQFMFSRLDVAPHRSAATRCRSCSSRPRAASHPRAISISRSTRSS